jgi:hypothetical protein
MNVLIDEVVPDCQLPEMLRLAVDRENARCASRIQFSPARGIVLPVVYGGTARVSGGRQQGSQGGICAVSVRVPRIANRRKCWIGLIVAEWRAALNSKTGDNESFGTVVSVLGRLASDDKDVVDFVRVRIFRVVELDWDNNISASVSSFCSAWAADVNLSEFAEFANGIGVGDRHKIDFLIILWRGIGDRVVRAAVPALDHLVELDVEVGDPQLR